MKTLLLLLVLFIPANAQTKPVSFGGVFVGFDRSAPVTTYFQKIDPKEFRISLTTLIIFQPNKRKFNLGITLSQPFGNKPPNLRIGITTRIF